MSSETRIPLKTWLAAIWFVTSQKHGANALGLKRVLGSSGSYQTAWTWLHKLQTRDGASWARAGLHGRVEVDETLVEAAKKAVSVAVKQERKKMWSSPSNYTNRRDPDACA